VARRVIGQAEGERCGRRRVRHGQTTDQYIALANADPSSSRPGMDMLMSSGEQIPWRSCHGYTGYGLRRHSLTAPRPKSSPTPLTGEARMSTSRLHRVRKELEKGTHCHRCGDSRASARLRDYNIGPGRLGHNRGGARRSAQGRHLRDLNTMFRACSPQTPDRSDPACWMDQLRGDARTGEHWARKSANPVVEMASNTESKSWWSAHDEIPARLSTEEEHSEEQVLVRGIAHNLDEAKFTVRHVPDNAGIAARIFRLWPRKISIST